MDEYGNSIPGPSKGFEGEEIMEPTTECDFAWLENEFDVVNINESLKVPINIDQNNQNFKSNEIDSSLSNNIEDFFEEIRSIDFSKNQNVQINDTHIELLERCNNYIDIVGRNIVYLEEMTSEIKRNISISKRNANKAHECIMFEKLSMRKTAMQNLKKKACLANFFKIGFSNCPYNPHLMELYETGRLVLAYNGRFILEECVERNLWNQEFKNKLEQTIHEEVLNKIKTPMIEQHARLGIKQEFENDPLIKNKIELERLEIHNELKIISNTPFKRLVYQFMDSDTKYDWLHIAKITNKPHLQCERFWNLLLKPHISRAKWNKDEENKLIQIAIKYGEKNWQQIANELGTNRNELQCFVHYQRYKKILYKKGKWSKQEDEKLREIIKENSIDSIINWQKVYFAMHNEGRSVDQIYNRWTSCLKPGIKKGLLNETEKYIINIAQKKKLPASVVSMNLTNRTAAQIRNAYRRISQYDQDILRGGWMPEEDKMLLRAVNPYALNELSWKQVSKQVPGRNPEQCRHRFNLIEKKIQKNPKITVENFSRIRRSFNANPYIPVNNDLLDTSNLQNNFKQNRQLQKLSDHLIETDADRKLKKSYLDNVYVTKHCNFSSKCELFKYILDYMGVDLMVPQEFVHKEDLIDEGLMSMITYLKECSIDILTLEPNKIGLDTIDTNYSFIYEGANGVLKTSDIMNSDISEIEGLFDIRMRNFDSKISKSITDSNSVSKKMKLHQLPLHSMGSVPPNFETFKMLYTYLNSLTTCLKTDNLKEDSNINFNWDNEESKKLHQRLVAIFRWPALFSGLVDYNAAKINMMINTVQTTDSNINYHSQIPFFHTKKKSTLYFNLKKFK